MKPAVWRPATPPSEKLLLIGAPIALRDGSRVRIRRLRDSDSELLLRGFRRLSPESRYRRFLAPTPELSERTLRYLVEIDHRNHEALIAVDEECNEGVGVARYVRNPARPNAAEVAVTVVDDWQGRGLGTLLLEAITMRAREEGVDTFTALMLVDNSADDGPAPAARRGARCRPCRRGGRGRGAPPRHRRQPRAAEADSSCRGERDGNTDRPVAARLAQARGG